MRKVKDSIDFDHIDFDTFARVFAVLLEDAHALKNQSRSQSHHILDDDVFNQQEDGEFYDDYY